MPDDEHLAVLRYGAAGWNAWRAEHDEVPDLSWAGLRGLDLSGFDLSRADLRGADLRGTNCSDANLAGAQLEGANLFKAVLAGADLVGAFLYGAQFLNCAQLLVTRNWQSAFREALGCGAAILAQGGLTVVAAAPEPGARSEFSGASQLAPIYFPDRPI
jgi:Pentapeptide repeats (8 copies)